MPDSQSAQARLRFGVVTDLHWNGHKDVVGNRYYKDSLVKLGMAVASFNQYGVDFAVNLGDTLDSLREGDPDLALLKSKHAESHSEWYHVLGNHDADMCGEPVDRNVFVQTFGMPAPYYSFDRAGIHLIVLDGNHAEDGIGWAPSWDRTWLGQEQLHWLAQDLRLHVHQPTIVLMHQLAATPDEEAGAERGHTLRDADDLRRILELSGNVGPVISGHHHAGPYRYVNDIHYLALKGMVQGPAENSNSYAIVTITESLDIQVEGFGREPSRSLSWL